MSYPIFDRSKLKLKPLAERRHDMTLGEVLSLDAPGEPFDDPQLEQVAERVMRARRNGAPVILMMGAHVIKVGLSRFVIDLMERRIVTHVGMNGAGPIHDFELALVVAPKAWRVTSRQASSGCGGRQAASTTPWPQVCAKGWVTVNRSGG
jgi:hypothetical protein